MMLDYASTVIAFQSTASQPCAIAALLNLDLSTAEQEGAMWRSKSGPLSHCEELVPVVHGKAPGRSASAARLASPVSHAVSKRLIWLDDEAFRSIALPPTIHRMVGSRDSSLHSTARSPNFILPSARFRKTEAS